MPIYLYQCSTGHITEDFQHGGSAAGPKPGIMCDECGKRAKKIFDHSGKNSLDSQHVDRPRYSDAMGINPDQERDFMARYPGSEYDGEGRLLIKNRAHKQFEMKRRGYFD